MFHLGSSNVGNMVNLRKEHYFFTIIKVIQMNMFSYLLKFSGSLDLNLKSTQFEVHPRHMFHISLLKLSFFGGLLYLSVIGKIGQT